MVLTYANKQFDLLKPLDISLHMKEGDQVNCYYAPPFTAAPVVMGSFIGDIAQGGVVNYKNVQLNPHGNGTHTECIAHVTSSNRHMGDLLTRYHFLARVVSVTPELQADGDRIIPLSAFEALEEGIEAVVIRTLPNEAAKRTRQYSGTNPPYLDPEAAAFFRDKGVEHVLIDLPSLDREVDGGKLSAHRAFWDLPERPREQCTITELIYVPDTVKDGIYLLNLQVMAMELDAAPSRPVLYPLC